MFTTTDMIMNTLEAANPMADEKQAISLSEKAQRSAALKRMFAFLTGRCSCLLSLDQVVGSRPAANRHYLGICVVPISQILGSETRTADFDASFQPLNRRTMYR